MNTNDNGENIHDGGEFDPGLGDVSPPPPRRPRRRRRSELAPLPDPVVVPESVGLMPVHSEEAERYLISCLLIDCADTLARCRLARLRPGAFYIPANQVLFGKICEMAAAAKPVDLATLYEELRAARLLDAVGGMGYLTKVSGAMPTRLQVDYFVRRVFECWVLREAERYAFGLVEGVRNWSGEDVGLFLAQHALKMQRGAAFAQRQLVESLRDRLARRRELMHDEVAGRIDKSRQLVTGLPHLDACILPFDTRSEDWYIIIGGPPSGGKSSFMRFVALCNLLLGKRCAVFLLETGLRWVDQAAATLARVNLRTREEWQPDMLARWDAEFSRLQEWSEERMWVFEDVYEVEEIEARVRDLDRQLRARDVAAGVPDERVRGLDFIVVDYLQIVKTRKEFFSEEQRLTHVSGTFKQMLKLLDIYGLIGAQINRESRAEGKPPTMAALRGSGSLEQDVDRLIFVHTPAENRAGIPQDGANLVDEVEIIQRKSRNGPKDISVLVNFHKQYTLYTEAAHRGDAPPGAPKPENGYKRKEGGK